MGNTRGKLIAVISSVLLTGSVIGGTARAFEFDRGALQLRLDLKGSAQGAHFDPPDLDGNKLDGVGEWSVRGSLDYTARNGWLVGARVEVDSDFDVDSDTATVASDFTDVALDEAYGYVSSRWGRIELGLQDGPADQLSFSAPTLGLGQVRGDFIRYVGNRRALLSPYDSRDSLKVIYLSPPVRGFRMGVSYGPEFTANEDAALPTSRTDQKNPAEAAAQFQSEAGAVILGVSGAYVQAKAEPITERQDVKSWSVGGEARWHGLIVGGAYVDRGDSNADDGLDQTEINYGLGWRGERWGVAMSGATVDSSDFDTQLAGIGGYVDLYRDYVRFKADAVYFEDDFPAELAPDGITLLPPFTEDGFAVLAELEIRL